MPIKLNFGPFLTTLPWKGDLSQLQVNWLTKIWIIMFFFDYNSVDVQKRTVLCTYHKKPLTCKLMTSRRHFTTTTYRILVVFTFKFGDPSEVWITKALICTKKKLQKLQISQNEILSMTIDRFYLCFLNSRKIWYLSSWASIRNCVWCYYRLQITSIALEKCKKKKKYIFWFKVFVDWKLELPNFPMDSVF